MRPVEKLHLDVKEEYRGLVLRPSTARGIVFRLARPEPARAMVAYQPGTVPYEDIVPPRHPIPTEGDEIPAAPRDCAVLADIAVAQLRTTSAADRDFYTVLYFAYKALNRGLGTRQFARLERTSWELDGRITKRLRYRGVALPPPRPWLYWAVHYYGTAFYNVCNDSLRQEEVARLCQRTPTVRLLKVAYNHCDLRWMRPGKTLVYYFTQRYNPVGVFKVAEENVPPGPDSEGPDPLPANLEDVVDVMDETRLKEHLLRVFPAPDEKELLEWAWKGA
jgi:hypothetical protein